jgi:hypothetical protein
MIKVENDDFGESRRGGRRARSDDITRTRNLSEAFHAVSLVDCGVVITNSVFNVDWRAAVEQQPVSGEKTRRAKSLHGACSLE